MTKRAPLRFDNQRVTEPPRVPDKTGVTTNVETRKQSSAQTKTVRDRGRFIAGHVSPEAKKQFDLLSVQVDKTTQDLVVEAINDLFAKYGLSRIA